MGRRRRCPASRLKSSSVPMRPKASRSCQGAGWSRELLLGSVAVEDWPRTGRTSIAKRSPSCASLQSASCSENFVIPPEVIGQTLRKDRLETDNSAVNKLAQRPHQFRERKGDDPAKIFVPIVSSENREYFPAGLADQSVIPTNKAFYIPNGPLWALAVIASKLHLSWIDTICGRLRTDYSVLQHAWLEHVSYSRPH